MRFLHLFIGLLCAVVFPACNFNAPAIKVKETAESEGMPGVFVGILYDQFWSFDGLVSMDSFHLSDTWNEDSSGYMKLLYLPIGEQKLRFVSGFGDTIIQDCLPSIDTLTIVAPGIDYYQVFEHYPITFENTAPLDTLPQPNFRHGLKQYGTITIGLVSGGCFHYYEAYKTYTLLGDYLVEQTNIISGSAIAALEYGYGGDTIKTVVLPASYIDTLQLLQQKLFEHAKASNTPQYKDLGNGLIQATRSVWGTNRYYYTFCLGRNVHRIYTHSLFPYTFDYAEHNVVAMPLNF